MVRFFSRKLRHERLRRKLFTLARMDPEMLADGATLGDRFVALLGTPHSRGWLPAAELFGGRLPAALGAVGSARGTVSPAVAGMLLFEQYAQRLVAPVLAALHREGTVVDATLPAVSVEVVDGRVRRLAFTRAPHAAGPDREATHARVVGGLVAGNLEPAADAVHRHTRVGMRLLRGAMANAAVSALLHMSWQDDDRARFVPEARAFLGHAPRLAKLVTVDAVEIAGERWMYCDRNTCCLAFRTTVNQARDQQYCSSCPVLPRHATRALFTRATAVYADRNPRPNRSS
jgi:ferric iron reductase protein FhuF